MTLREFFKIQIDPDFKDEFRSEKVLINLRRGRSIAVVVIIIEIVLLFASLTSVATHKINPWSESNLQRYYTVMYSILIGVLGISLLFFKRLERIVRESEKGIYIANLVIWLMAVFIMTWGAVVALLDQKSYGNIVAFMINMIMVGVMFYMEARYLIAAYGFSLAVFLIGLPFVQSSPEIVVGHYINISIFTFLSFIVARMLYTGYVNDFMNRKTIEQKNMLLTNINDSLVREIDMRREAQNQMQKINQELADLSLIDELTGIPNRRRLEGFLDFEWRRSLRQKTPLSLIMIDIDFFKLYNDHYGHPAGDQCLITVAGALDKCRQRSTDFVARYGGEEFLFIATDIDETGTKILAENLRRSVEELNIPHQYSPVSPYVTISLGTATVIPAAGQKVQEVVNLADQALYHAKHSGRNCVVSMGA